MVVAQLTFEQICPVWSRYYPQYLAERKSSTNRSTKGITSDIYYKMKDIVRKAGISLEDPKSCIVGEAYGWKQCSLINDCKICQKFQFDALELRDNFVTKFVKHINERHADIKDHANIKDQKNKD